MDPYESPRVDPYALRDLETADLLPPDPAGEQLGMLHGLLYVAGLGTATVLNEYVRAAYHAGDFPFHWWPLAILVALDGAGLAAVVLAIWRRVERRRTFPARFGHWLLLALGVECLLSGCYQLICFLSIQGVEVGAAGELPPGLELRMRATGSLLILLFIITPVVAMFYSKGEKFWQRYAPLMVVSSLWYCVRHYFALEQNPSAAAVTNLISFLNLLCFLVAAGRDVQHPEGMDQVHWVGLGVHGGLILYYRFVEYYWGTG